jgi:hypothetical protein
MMRPHLAASSSAPSTYRRHVRDDQGRHLGLIRFIEFLGSGPAWWGLWCCHRGGVRHPALCARPTDLKRLLAFHSIENIGIILLGLGVRCW